MQKLIKLGLFFFKHVVTLLISMISYGRQEVSLTNEIML